MVGPQDRVKVLDFGLAKLREHAAGAAETVLPSREISGPGRILGTVAYMSPEQAEGRAVDERSDVFSLGVVLYEMACGDRPFKGDTSLSVLSAILRDTPKPLAEVNPALPREVSRIVRRCWQRTLTSATSPRPTCEAISRTCATRRRRAPTAFRHLAPRAPAAAAYRGGCGWRWPPASPWD